MGLSVLGGLVALFDALFPDLPSKVDVRDKAAAQALFYSGDPAMVLCDNRTIPYERVGATMRAAARSLPTVVGTFLIDCTAPIGGGGGGEGEAAAADTYKRFGINRAAQPAYFMVGNGRRPAQLPPSASYNASELAAAVTRSGMLTSRHTRVDNDRDLDACLRDRSGGCMLVYTAKDAKEVAADLVPLVDAHRAVQFAVLRASTVVLRAGNGTALQALLREGIAAARRNAAEAGADKGIVLVHAKRLPPAQYGGGTGGLLVTVRAAAGGAASREDVAGVLAASAAASARLKEDAARGMGGGVDDAIEALLAREETMKEEGCAVVSRGEVGIARAAVKQAPPASGGQHVHHGKRARKPVRGDTGEEAEEGEGQEGSGGGGKFDDALRRREARNSARNAREASGEDLAADDEAAAEADAARREREARQRARMADEEMASAHVAHAAAEEGDESGGSGEGEGEGEVEGEVEDLDGELEDEL